MSEKKEDTLEILSRYAKDKVTGTLVQLAEDQPDNVIPKNTTVRDALELVTKGVMVSALPNSVKVITENLPKNGYAMRLTICTGVLSKVGGVEGAKTITLVIPKELIANALPLWQFLADNMTGSPVVVRDDAE